MISAKPGIKTTYPLPFLTEQLPAEVLDEAVIRDAALHRTTRDLKDLDALMAKLAAVWHDPAEGSYCNWQLQDR
jgi:hypothetical protein